MEPTEEVLKGQTDEKKNSCPCCKNSTLLPHPWPIVLSMVLTVVSTLFYLADTLLDCKLVYNYYHDSTYEQTEDSDDYSHLLARSKRFRIYFWLTLGFVILPTLIFNVRIIRMIRLMTMQGGQLPLWLTRQAMCGILGLIPVLSASESFYHKLKLLRSHNADSKMQKEIKRKVETAEFISTGLRFLEKTFEAAPQLVLQLFIMLFEPLIAEDYQRKHSWDSVPPIYYFTTISSLVSVAWAATSNEGSEKESKYSKPDSIAGKILLFFWHLFVTCFRVSAIILAVTYPVRTDWGFLIVPAILVGAWLFTLVTIKLLDQGAAVFTVDTIENSISLLIVETQEIFSETDNMHRLACVTYLSEYIALLLAFALASPFDTPGTYLLPAEDFWQIGCFLAPFGFFVAGIAFMFVYHAWYDPLKPFQSPLDALKYSVCIIPLPRPHKPTILEMLEAPAPEESYPILAPPES